MQGLTMRKEVIGDCTLYLGDCRDVLPQLKSFDALVTDPPYGIGEARGKNVSRSSAAIARNYGDAAWDDAPAADDVIDLCRSMARWQVIFGGNFYALPPSSCWLVWDKKNGANDFADCELAWTNIPKAVRRLEWLWHGMIRRGQEARGFHPTQKPVGVMEWCIGHIPAGCRTILDPFMGSGTTGVACVKMGRVFTGIEINETYFDAACSRIAAAYAQPNLFHEPEKTPVQQHLFEGAA